MKKSVIIIKKAEELKKTTPVLSDTTAMLAARHLVDSLTANGKIIPGPYFYYLTEEIKEGWEPEDNAPLTRKVEYYYQKGKLCIKYLT